MELLIGQQPQIRHIWAASITANSKQVTLLAARRENVPSALGLTTRWRGSAPQVPTHSHPATAHGKATPINGATLSP